MKIERYFFVLILAKVKKGCIFVVQYRGIEQ